MWNAPLVWCVGVTVWVGLEDAAWVEEYVTGAGSEGSKPRTTPSFLFLLSATSVLNCCATSTVPADTCVSDQAHSCSVYKKSNLVW